MGRSSFFSSIEFDCFSLSIVNYSCQVFQQRLSHYRDLQQRKEIQANVFCLARERMLLGAGDSGDGLTSRNIHYQELEDQT